MTLATRSLLDTPALGIALEGPARPKRGKPRGIKAYAAKLARVAKKAPEVIVKVSGSGKNRAHSLAHLTYITRNGKLEAENERGEKIVGKEAVMEVFKEWGFQTPGDSERKRAQTVNIVLSMPEGTRAQGVLDASRDFAAETFGANHQYLLALHTDTKQPHVHVAVKAQGFDMTWLKRSKADLQEWRETFAEKLRERGIEAEATPRRARGVIQKAKTQAMRHLVDERRSTVLEAKVDEAVQVLAGGEKDALRPWEVAIQKRQKQVRAAYVEEANKLFKAPDEASRQAATQLADFLKSLPPMETERHRLNRQLIAQVSVHEAPKALDVPSRDTDRDHGRER